MHGGKIVESIGGLLAKLVACVIAVLLAACAQRVETNVTEFHSFQAPPRGKTFILIPYKSQQGSLEWKSYADLVAAQLEKNGLVRSDKVYGTDYAVFLAYAIDDGHTSVSAAPVYGQTGGGTSTTTSGFVGRTPVSVTSYTPATYGVTGYVPVESTVYGRAVRITMIDVGQSLADNKPAPVYEATATSAGSIGNLNVVIGPMIEGVFKDWPGPSGKTRREAISIKD